MTIVTIKGRLLLLPTPIGDGAVTDVLPAGVVATAHATRYFLAERAKTARAFLKAIGHPEPLQSLQVDDIGHEPDAARFEAWLRPTREGHDVALVSEAGAPAVADPGASLVAYAHAHGIPVHPLVGPSALLLALMASGLNGQRFRFVGYLPQESGALAKAIAALESASRTGETQFFIETPYRNDKMFDALLRTCAPDTRMTIAAALTAADEFVLTCPVAAWRERDRPPLRDRPAIFALLAQGAPGGTPRR